jgi:anionic cell wall polymer biosynthesis LytR-Cps2A-Psr (LCP) family protein
VRRQTEVIRAIFDGFRTKGIVMTAIMADQVLSGIETNLTSTELMQDYANFSSRTGWSMKSHTLPVKTLTADGKTYEQPVLDACRALLTTTGE